MNEPAITCPNCKTEIKLTESLAAPLLQATRQQYEQKLGHKELDIAQREAAIQELRSDVAKARQNIDQQVSAIVVVERERIAADEARKARLLIASDFDLKAKEIAELQRVLQERDTKLAEAQSAQVELLRKQRDLDDAKREVELTVEKRVGESLAFVRDKAKQEAEEALKLKVIEKEEQIASMQRQIEELRRRAEQGSQQLQGEALELALDSLIKSAFPFDDVEPVPKGMNGADLIQKVVSRNGHYCGTILWESKRTKAWNDLWIAKLKDDQRAVKADLAVLVTEALPKDCANFYQLNGVWVTNPQCALSLAVALRLQLEQVAMARLAATGKNEKMEVIYQYLSGAEFRQRVEAIVETFMELQEDLFEERRIAERRWARREKQIQKVISSTSGMYGDLQGLIGSSLQNIPALTARDSSCNSESV
jgi:hypothetical protein